jgi:hypothetical protein
VIARLRTAYGADLLHLAVHLLALALVAFAAVQMLELPDTGQILLWLVGAVLLHDIVLLPLYSLLDRGARAGGRLRGRALNHVRVPAGIALLLLLVFAGPISGRSDPVAERVGGLPLDGALERWLLAVAVLFAGSGALFAVRRQRRSA